MSAASTEIFPIAQSAAVPAPVEVIGFKAHNLARVASLGLPVPPAFVIGTPFCRRFFREGGKLPTGIRDLLAAHIRTLEAASGLSFGSERRPLLVSVRSGAPVSMPGMMETVLNVGLTEASARGLLRATGNPRLVWDSMRRLVQSFAGIVHRCPAAPFAAAEERALRAARVESVGELDFRSLADLAAESLRLFQQFAGRPFPQDPFEQLEAAVRAVLESWRSAKAVEYRRLNSIDEKLGTAVTVQRMVFGNAGGTSGAGVAFTRDPATGQRALYMDFVFNAQGEDVVSGRRALRSPVMLEQALPAVQRALEETAPRLEAEFRDAQELEFTVENGVLFLLQTRSAKRTPWAALRIAVEQVREGLITPAAALERLAPYDLAAIRQVHLAAVNGARLLCRAQTASIGVATGAITLSSEAAAASAAAGRDSILVRNEISTDDFAGVAAARGVLSAAGARTSHAAVVARQLDKVCLVACPGLVIDAANHRCAIGGEWLNEGDTICLDGGSGDVYAGTPGQVIEKPSSYLAEVASWRAA